MHKEIGCCDKCGKPYLAVAYWTLTKIPFHVIRQCDCFDSKIIDTPKNNQERNNYNGE